MRALALLSATALSAAALTACDGGATEPPFLPEASPTHTAQATLVPEATPTTVPTPTAAPETPTPPPQSGDMDGFRAFAAQIETAVLEADTSFFAAAARLRTYTCMGGDADTYAPACADQSAGAMVQAFLVGFVPGEGALVTLTYFEEALKDWLARGQPDLSDEYGGGGVLLYALAHEPARPHIEGVVGASQEAYIPIVTGIVGVPPPGGINIEPLVQDTLRSIRLLYWQFVDGRWRLTSSDLSGDPELIATWLSGECSECYDQWERWEGTP